MEICEYVGCGCGCDCDCDCDRDCDCDYDSDSDYDYSLKGVEVPISSRGKTVQLDAPLDHINLHVRGGFVLPTQEPANNTVYR